MRVQCVYGKGSHEMHARLRGPNNLFIFPKSIPCLADAPRYEY